MNPELLARYLPRMLEGLVVTLELVVLSVALGAMLSLPIALARLSPNWIWRSLSFGYVYFFRGTPLLAQTYLVYYGSGQFRHFLDAIGLWVFFRDAFFCCVLTFTLNTAAYQAEILRGAMRAISHGQREAAMSLGNELILMVKSSAIAAIVTVFDLMGATRLAYARSFDISFYLWAALFYLAIVETLRRVWDRLEKRMTRHLAFATHHA
jgi:polar amino acid transport system permease protein